MASPILSDGPRSVDILADSQLELRNDMNYVSVAYGKDHQVSAFPANATSSFEGRHKQVSFNNRANVNLPMPGDGTNSLLWGSGGNLFFKNGTLASGVQLTNNTAGVPLDAQNGYTWLPGGILLQWGLAAIAAPLSITIVNFPIAFAATAYSVTITQVYSGTSIDRSNSLSIGTNTGAVSATQFRIQNASSSAGVTGCYWMAIGRK